MPYFEVHLDYETSERAGAGGMFQVISVEDEKGNDRTQHVDQGKHFRNLQEVKEALAISLSIPAANIELNEV
jgi:type I restriction enzyme S subunit